MLDELTEAHGPSTTAEVIASSRALQAARAFVNAASKGQLQAQAPTAATAITSNSQQRDKRFRL